MKKYVAYFKPTEDRYYIEYTEVWKGRFRLEFYRGFVPLDITFDTLEDARRFLKNVKKPIVEIV